MALSSLAVLSKSLEGFVKIRIHDGMSVVGIQCDSTSRFFMADH